MFYSQLLLAKKGPLARVWLAAHWERKLNKSLIAQTDIKAAAEALKKPTNPLSLRLSGHLLLGIARIFAKKVQYLFVDSSTALHTLNAAPVRAGGAGGTNDQYDEADEEPTANAAAAVNRAPRPKLELAPLDGSGMGGLMLDNPLEGGDGDEDVLLFGGGFDIAPVGGKVAGGQAASATRGRRIPLHEAGSDRGGGGGMGGEVDDFALPQRGGGGGRGVGSEADDEVEALRREVTPGAGAGAGGRPSLGLVASSGRGGGAGTGDESRSGALGSEGDESIRRSRGGVGAGGEDAAAAAVLARRAKQRTSIAAGAGGEGAAGFGDLDGGGMGLGSGEDAALFGIDALMGGGGGGGMDLDDIGAPLGGFEGGGEGGGGGYMDLEGDQQQQQQQGEGDVGADASVVGKPSPAARGATARMPKEPTAEAAAAAAAAKAKRAAQAKSRSLREPPASTILPSETIRAWISSAEPTMRPHRDAAHRAAGLHSQLEDAYGKSLIEGPLAKGGKAPANPSGAPLAGLAMGSALQLRLSRLALSPYVWGIAAAGVEEHATRFAAEEKKEGTAGKVAHAAHWLTARAGTHEAARSAAIRRKLIGLPAGGLGDVATDGSVLFHIPPVMTEHMTEQQTNALLMSTCVEQGGAMISPALATMLISHSHLTAKYPKRTDVAGGEAEDEGGEGAALEVKPKSKSERAKAAAAAAVAAKAGGENVDVGGDLFDMDLMGGGGGGGGDFDFDVAAPGATGEDGAVAWHEGDAEAGGAEGLGSAPPSAKAKVGPTPPSRAVGTSLLEQALAKLSAAKEAQEVEDMDAQAQEEVGDEAGATPLGGAIPSAFVAAEKWHEQTIFALRSLASMMTGPIEGSGEGKGSSKAAAAKKRRAIATDFPDGLAPPPDGNLADTASGRGSSTDPLSFEHLTDHAQRSKAAQFFFQLLVLKSWDVIHVAQSVAYGDVEVSRTERFAQAFADHTA